ACLRDAGQRGSMRFEVTATPALIGFQVVALGPLVPRVGEDEVLFRCGWLETIQRGSQPAPVGVGCRTMKDPGSLMAPRAVVPGSHHAWEAHVLRRRQL